jgi:hypothetical protein
VLSSDRPLGISALSLFFAAGVIPATVSALALAWPGAWADAVWGLKPEARSQFAQLGPMAIPLMILVALGCAAAAVGLWKRRSWGQRLAIGLLGLNVVGDALNGVVRNDWRTLIGLPIGGAMLAYLLSRRVRDWLL